jgi:hypothetical protein
MDNAPSTPLPSRVMLAFFGGIIRAYQLMLSPFMAPSCRFMPSCSDYAAEAIRRHGACAGGWLALKRLARCHPLGGKGIDNVPE